MLARWEGRTTAPAALARDMVEKRGWMSVTVRTAAAVCPRACRVRDYIIEDPGARWTCGRETGVGRSHRFHCQVPVALRAAAISSVLGRSFGLDSASFALNMASSFSCALWTMLGDGDSGAAS